MRYLILSLMFIFYGCASAPMTGYISRADHPYNRKFNASFEKVISSIVYVLKNEGWVIDSEADPAVYERDDRYDSSIYQNLLIMTSIKKNGHVLYSTFTHLNVFIHSIGNTCDVEIRYEARTPLVHQFISVHNDQLVQGILDAVEQEIDK